jgi:Uma2 family endonuclease
MSIAPDNWFQKHLINVDEYYRMAEVGLLAPDARVELIEGEVMDMALISSGHASVVDTLNELLIRELNRRAIVAIQRPIRLDARSEPEPDISLLKPRVDRYRDAHPTASDVLLIVEVSASSLRYDLDIKVPLYGRHRIPEVWIVDIAGKKLHCLRDPNGEYYSSTTIITSGTADVAAIPGLKIDLTSVLSP